MYKFINLYGVRIRQEFDVPYHGKKPPPPPPHSSSGKGPMGSGGASRAMVWIIVGIFTPLPLAFIGSLVYVFTQ